MQHSEQSRITSPREYAPIKDNMVLIVPFRGCKTSFGTYFIVQPQGALGRNFPLPYTEKIALEIFDNHHCEKSSLSLLKIINVYRIVSYRIVSYCIDDNEKKRVVQYIQRNHYGFTVVQLNFCSELRSFRPQSFRPHKSHFAPYKSYFAPYRSYFAPCKKSVKFVVNLLF